MLKKYSYWETTDGSEGSLMEGEVPHPQAFEPDAKIIWFYTIQAETFEEAHAIHNLRRGFSPYYPMGEPIECTNCENYFYLGSGECFCGHRSV